MAHNDLKGFKRFKDKISPSGYESPNFDDFAGNNNLVHPIVDFLPPNIRLVMCSVGPHKQERPA
jgi:hypothetical protein